MKLVYSFKEGNKDMRDLLGGKGANLAEMTVAGLPIPTGFTVTTESCHVYYDGGEQITSDMEFQILSKIKDLETETGKVFGNPQKPLLVSVRSGAPVSMPGMMDSILNLGMNEEICDEMAKENPRMAYDAYRRFIQMYATVVMNYPESQFSGYLDEYKKLKGYDNDLDLTADDLHNIVIKYKNNYLEIGGTHFPEDPKVQLMRAISAVFKSWHNDRAIKYRKLNGIDDNLGTAVNVQEMVYGNKNDKSGSGVLFSRKPSTGADELTGEYLLNAQGEDIVSGVRTPHQIIDLKEIMPYIYDELYRTAKGMETHYCDVQDMEFTIDDGKLYILQTRNAKRTPEANVKFALDFLKEKKIDEKECLLRIKPDDLEVLLKPTFDLEALKTAEVLTSGLAASPGVAVGHLVFKSEDAKKLNDHDSILVRNETSPEDIDGMVYANGILTKNGGLTSHAAVVARGFGECAVCGAGELEIDEVNETLTIKGKVFTKNDYISIDGSSGKIYAGKVKTAKGDQNNELLNEILSIISKYEGIKVRANADTREAAETAKKFGATGIGLVRTEHMFFNAERILQMRRMILAATEEERLVALKELEKFQEEDFTEILRVMKDLPVIVRYLDPPLHEFLPKGEKEIKECAETLKITEAVINERINELKEVNPMMGFRGCRLGVKYPEISAMQTEALVKAALTVKKEGIEPNIEMMVPLTTDVIEFNYIKGIIDNTTKKLFGEEKLEYKVGTMIETPRGALMSQTISKYADFYSFGTNDLTQLTYGLSRDDAGKFLDSYYDKKVYQINPFKTLDTLGVGTLMSIAKETAVRKIEMGICGEHGGEEESIKFCHKLGLDYVSCSPFRVPSARLVSAQIELRNEK